MIVLSISLWVAWTVLLLLWVVPAIVIAHGEITGRVGHYGLEEPTVAMFLLWSLATLIGYGIVKHV